MRNKKNVEYTSRLIDRELNYCHDYSNYSTSEDVYSLTKEVVVDSEQLFKMNIKMRSVAGSTILI